MAAFAAVFPILPGKLDEWKRFTQELTGPRRSAWQAAHRRLGIRTEQSFLQHTPQGDVAILYLEADDPMRVNQAIAGSGDPVRPLVPRARAGAARRRPRRPTPMRATTPAWAASTSPVALTGIVSLVRPVVGTLYWRLPS